MKEKIYILFLGIMLAVGMLLGGFAAGWSLRGKQMVTPTADTITITKVDTVTLVEPMVDTLIRFVDRLYPVTDTVWRNDTMFVQLPYEHRYYARKDTLEIWYSGVDPKIDSARMYHYQTTKIIKQPYEVSKMPRFTADLGVAAFYYDKSINPLLFVETRYNAPKTTWQIGVAVNHEGKWGVAGGVSYRFGIK